MQVSVMHMLYGMSVVSVCPYYTHVHALASTQDHLADVGGQNSFRHCVSQTLDSGVGGLSYFLNSAVNPIMCSVSRLSIRVAPRPPKLFAPDLLRGMSSS